MLAIVILFILTLIFILIARICYDNIQSTKLPAIIDICIASILGITFCILLIVLYRNLFTIPEISAFITLCIFFWTKDKDLDKSYSFKLFRAFSVISLIIVSCIYISNFGIKFSYEEKNTYNILFEDDASNNIVYVEDISQRPVIFYNYQSENGEIMSGNIPADFTTINYVDDIREAHVDIITQTSYRLNHNTTPPSRCFEKITKKYELYIPENVVTEIMQN